MNRDRYLSIDEVAKLRTVTETLASHDERHHLKQGGLTWLLVDLALSTGLRVSEIALIKLEDVDAKRGYITVTRLKKREKTGVIKPDGKPEYRRRVVREPLAVSPELLAHVQGYAKARGLKKGPLFVGQRGPLTKLGLQQIWRMAIQRAGLPIELSIHCARHTLATHLLRKTKNLRQVQLQLGHSSPAVTANMYAGVTFEEMQAGVTGLYDTKTTP